VEKKEKTRKTSMTYSIDFRKRVLGVKAERETSIAETAKRFAIGKATIVRRMQRVDAKLRRRDG